MGLNDFYMLNSIDTNNLHLPYGCGSEIKGISEAARTQLLFDKKICEKLHGSIAQ